MTEHEWLTATDPEPMWPFFRDDVSDRKLRLLAVAWSREIVTKAGEPKAMRAVEASEQFADGNLSEDELGLAHDNVRELWNHAHQVGEVNHTFPRYVRFAAAYQVSRPRARKVLQEIGLLLRESDGLVSNEYQVQATRDILGNPFRPVAIGPAWRTSTVVALARGIYDEKAFDRMPILADALQDAGCDNDDVLSHCRGGGPHVRGCWVVDLLLGKE
jgi:hypothetical protein